jgi:hypothetical protein
MTGGGGSDLGESSHMGIEYKITCGPAAASRFDEYIRSAPFFESYDADRGHYYLRLPGVPGNDDWSHGIAAIEEDGIYFCDTLTSKESAAQILRSLIDHALQHSDRITIHEP